MNNRELAAELAKALPRLNQMEDAASIIEAVLNEQQPSNRPELPPAPWSFDAHLFLLFDATGSGIAEIRPATVGRALAKFPNAITALRQAAADLDAAAIACISHNSGDPFCELAATYRAMANAFERGEDPTDA